MALEPQVTCTDASPKWWAETARVSQIILFSNSNPSFISININYNLKAPIILISSHIFLFLDTQFILSLKQTVLAPLPLWQLFSDWLLLMNKKFEQLVCRTSQAYSSGRDDHIGNHVRDRHSQWHHTEARPHYFDLTILWGLYLTT